MPDDKLTHFLNTLPEEDGLAILDNAAFDQLLATLESELDGLPPNFNQIVSEALQERGDLQKGVSEPSGGGVLRGLYQKREIRIKKTALLGILSTLAVTPIFLVSLPAALTWSLQLAGFLESFISEKELELSLDEEKVHKRLFTNFFLPKSKISQKVRARFPDMTQNEIDNVLHRMESHGFVLVKNKDSEKR